MVWCFLLTIRPSCRGHSAEELFQVLNNLLDQHGPPHRNEETPPRKVSGTHQTAQAFQRRTEINTNWKQYSICCNTLFSEAILNYVDAQYTTK